MRVNPTMAALLVSLALSAPIAAQDTGSELARKKAEIERRIFGADRAARTQAALDALSMAKDLGEEFWWRVLEQRYPTLDEEEEMKFHAAEALRRVGTQRSRMVVDRLVKEPPKILLPATHDSGPTPKWNYGTNATWAYCRLKLERADTAIEARAKGLSKAAVGDLLVDLLVHRDAAFRTLTGEPCDLGRAWDTHVTEQLARLGGGGALSIARAIESTSDHTLRWALLDCLRTAFTKGSTSSDPTREALRSSREVREASVRSVRTWLRSPLHRDESSIPLVMTDGLQLVELEPDLIAFLEGGALVAPGMDEVKREQLFQSVANALATLDTETAIDYLVSRARWDIDGSARCVSRFLSALQSEPLTSKRFDGLLWSVCRRSAAKVDVATIENILTRAREQQTSWGSDEKEQGLKNLESLERALHNVRVWTEHEARAKRKKQLEDAKDKRDELREGAGEKERGS